MKRLGRKGETIGNSRLNRDLVGVSIVTWTAFCVPFQLGKASGRHESAEA